MFGHRYDKVICDVPCSGDGTLRRRPHCWKSWSMELLLQGRVHWSNIPVVTRGHENMNMLSKPGMWNKEAEPSTKTYHDRFFGIDGLRKGKKVGTISALEIRGFSLDIAQQAAADLVPWPSPFTSWRALGLFDLQHEPNRK